MPDYSLGRAHGTIEIDYDGSGAQKAARDIERTAASSDKLDESLTKTQKSLADTDREFDRTSDSAEDFTTAIDRSNKTLDDHSERLDRADETNREYRDGLEDTSRSHDEFAESAHRAAEAVEDLDHAEDRRHSHSRIRDRDRDHDIDGLRRSVDGLHDLRAAINTTDDSTHGLSKSLHVASAALSLLGPEGRAAALGLERVSTQFGIVGDVAQQSTGHIRSFVSHIAGFEMTIGKIGTGVLGGGALGGLAGLGGAAAGQGIVGMLDAVRQLSGALAMLPSAISGVAFSTQTLKIAFHGVGDAIKDMMADDPKKFLEDLKNMGPAAAQSMLAIAQFRNQFKFAGAMIQDSFWTKIQADIAPLVQTWLPAVATGMSQIAGVFGDLAHHMAGLFAQPAMLKAFETFVVNLGAGLKSLQPALAPLLNIFTELTVVGSGLFAQIGGQITQMLNFFAQVIHAAAESGALQAWITSGINAFGHLINIAYSFGAAFNHIMVIAEQFGGGGLLGWLDQVTAQLNAWVQSAAGQGVLQDFFATMRQATDAFLPMLPPLVSGLASLVSAFVHLGVGIAPGWQTFFDTFAQAMAALAPQIAATAPAINQFLVGMATALANLVNSVGPQLPTLFETLSNAFVALLPQMTPLLNMFLELVQNVGPQLPKLFGAVTDMIEALLPYVPVLVGFARDFVTVITGIINGSAGFTDAVTTMLTKLGDIIKPIMANLAKDAGKSFLSGLASGFADASGLSKVYNKAKNIVEGISSWFPRSPAKQGPFSGAGYLKVRGATMITDLADGMRSAQSAAANAAAATAVATSNALTAPRGRTTAAGSGGAGAPVAGGMAAVSGSDRGGTLLPPNIAAADDSILSAYLNHQFDDKRGLKGLAHDLGQGMQVFTDGFNLINQYVMQSMFGAMNAFGVGNQQVWKRTVSDQELARQNADELAKKAAGDKTGPDWADVFGAGAPAAFTASPNVPLGLGVSADSGPEDIQKAIIAAGRGRNLTDAQIQTALAVAAAESSYGQNIDGGIQGSAGWVGGVYQQSPSSGWGTREQVLDPNYAINAFYDAFTKQLVNNPTDPLLAAVLTQNPQLGAAARGSDYWDAVSLQLPDAGNALRRFGPGVTGPSWDAILGADPATPPSTPVPPRAGPTLPNAPIITPAMPGPAGTPTITDRAGPTLPTGMPVPRELGTGLPNGLRAFANPNSRAATLGGANTTYTPALLRNAGIAPLFTKTAPGSMDGAPAWVTALAGAFGLTATSHADTTLHGGVGQMGDWGFDFAGDVPNMQRFADFIANNLSSQTLQAIWQNPTTGEQLGIAGGQRVGRDQYYTGPEGFGAHQDHVHWATDVAPIMMGGDGSQLPAGMIPPVPSSFAGAGGGLLLPSGKTIDQLLDNTGRSAMSSDRLLQSYLAGNPQLAQQISTAQAPGSTDAQVQDALTGIDSTITGLKATDANGNRETINALSTTQRNLAGSRGFTQTQNPIMAFQSAAGGAANVITSVMQAVNSGLDSLAATQDIADRAVYGVSNTEDVWKIVNDVQKYITFAANVASAAGNVMTTIGNIAGMANAGEPGGNAGQALSSAGSIAELVGAGLQGVNAAISYAEEISHIIGGYVGRYLSFLTAGGPDGEQLMGNVRFLLNRNTGQLMTYSTDNPLSKNALDVPSWMRAWSEFGTGNPNPTTNSQLNIYAGPGQSPAEMMNQAMWLVNTGGTRGAMAATNF